MRGDATLTRLILTVLVSVVGCAVIVVWLLDLLPPDELSFAAGRPGGAYHAYAERYQAILARDGIVLEILDTAGSVDNAEALADGRADAGFLQGGVNPPADAGVEALAATFLEPLWVMHTGALNDPADPAVWRDLAIAAGEPGSGTRFVVDAVVAASGLDPARNRLLPLGGAAAADALQAGEVDVALFVAPVGAPYLQPLLDDPEVSLNPIRDGEALVRLLPFVQRADIPPAGIDYAARVPDARIDLVAMVGRLAARSDLHPALIDRLVNAARQVHRRRDLITPEGTFPSTAGTEMPVNVQAAAALASPSPLYGLLPYWIVAQISKFALLLVPILVLLVPLIRAVPGLYQWRMRARVYRRYLDLLEIDREVMGAPDPAALAPLGRRLDAIEAELVGLRLPPRFREYAYTMRVHIDLVRRQIAARQAAAVAP